MGLDYKATIATSDYKYIIRELNKVEPDLVKALKKDFREIGNTVRQGIQGNIPVEPKLRGMKRKLSPVGKTWNTTRRAKTVKVVLRSPKRAQDKNRAIVQLQVLSPATIIADMAGRGNASIDGQMTQLYVYPRAASGKRKHKVNGQGRAMIRKLGESPSRYVYPGAEEKMPEALQKTKDVVSGAIQEIENKING